MKFGKRNSEFYELHDEKYFKLYMTIISSEKWFIKKGNKMKKIYLSLIIIFSANLFSQSFEENLDIYCDYDGDGKSYDCDLYEQFANNNWVTKDWRGFY